MGLSEAITALLEDGGEHCDLAIELIKAHKRTQFVKTKAPQAEQQLEINPAPQSPVAPPVEPVAAPEPKHALADYREFVCKHILPHYPAGSELSYTQLEALFIQEALMRNWFLPSDHVWLAQEKPRWKIALSDALGSLATDNGPLSREKGKRSYVVNVF